MTQRKVCTHLRFLGLLLALVVAGAVIGSASGTASGDGPVPTSFRKGEVIVELKIGARIEDVNARHGTSTIQRVYGTNFYRLATPRLKKENKHRRKLAKDPDVLSASLNPVVVSPVSLFGRSTVGFPDGHPTIDRSRDQYALQTLFGDLEAIRMRSLGTGVIVAVIDTGIDSLHPDIAGHLWTNPGEIDGDFIDNDGNGLIDDLHGWDFVTGSHNPVDAPDNPDTSVSGHGTFIAGLIALVAPAAKIMPVRAFDSQGVSDAFTVSQAIKYAADNGARVINLSFGSPDDAALMHDAVRYATQRGILLVAAVGNDNVNTNFSPQFPANWNTEVMGVAAVDASDHKANFSNFGAGVSVAAPGVRLISLYPQANGSARYAQWSGTSFATPLAVAEAALILEKNSNTQALRSLIENTASSIDDRNPGFQGLLGRGRLNPLEALRTFDPPNTHAEILLYPTAVEPLARGHAEIETTDLQQQFEIEVSSARPRAHYRVFVDDVLVADDASTPAAVTSNFGSLRIEFSTQPDHDQLPLPPSMTPVSRIVHVEVRDDQNQIVLGGYFRPVTSGGGPVGQQFEKEVEFSATGVAPQASGSARIEVDSQRERLRVEADGLFPGSYRILADGVLLGFATPRSAYFRVEYTSDGSSGLLLPQSLIPAARIARVEVQNSVGQVVLEGVFGTSSGNVGGDDGGGGGGGSSEAQFTGAIENLPGGSFLGDWRVDGVTVHVSPATEIRQDKGPAVVGAQVEVRGIPQADGSVTATRIEVLSGGSGGGGDGGGGGGGGSETRFTGTIEAVPPGFIGTWVISGTIVHATSTTEIDDRDRAVVGATVEVRGSRQSDGSVLASRIKPEH